MGKDPPALPNSKFRQDYTLTLPALLSLRLNNLSLVLATTTFIIKTAHRATNYTNSRLQPRGLQQCTAHGSQGQGAKGTTRVSKTIFVHVFIIHSSNVDIVVRPTISSEVGLRHVLFSLASHLCLNELLISGSIEWQKVGELDKLCSIIVVPQFFHDLCVDSLVVHQRGADSKADSSPKASHKGLEFQGRVFTAERTKNRAEALEL